MSSSVYQGHDRHQGAGVVPLERPPHSLEAGDVLVPPLAAELRDLLGGPHVGPDGVPERRGGHGLRAETESSMVSWREAGEPMRVSGGGGGWAAHAACRRAAATGT